MSEFTIQGLDPVLKKLNALSSVKFRIKAVRSAGVKAMRIVRDAARSKAQEFDRPETPLNIAKNIQTRNDTRAGKKIGGVVVKVGVVGGAKNYANTRANVRARRAGKSYVTGGTTFYWRYLEFGTSKMAARPFMRPALEGNVGQVTDTFVSALNLDIDKIVAKGG